jgi:membrane protein DedA with SNARE-associated domain
VQTAIHWITRYGYAGVFSLLAMGIFGMPIPDEVLLTFVGFLIFRGRLHKLPAVVSAFSGTASGITASYGLGRCLGGYVLPRWGRSFHLGPERLGGAQGWLRHMGRWILTFGYFVPGLRHLTAFIAGASNLPFSAFTLFAYTGGLLWCLSFIGFGYFLGEGWASRRMQFQHKSHPPCRIRACRDSPVILAPHEDTERTQLETRPVLISENAELSA